MRTNNPVRALHYETGLPVTIDISDGIISDISETGDPVSMSEPMFVAPGLIDNQINGYTGVDFSDQGLTAESLNRAARFIRRDGVTTFQPTIITNTHENLIRSFRNLTVALKDRDIENSVPGFHLEGPYISPVEGYYGCHPSSCIRKASWEEFMQYQEAADGKIRQVTIAPEVDGAMDLIRKCVQNNIVVSIGHTNASADQISKAADSGASLSTHLGNGCANTIDRHRNPIWPQLANDLLSPSVIADGHHLLPEELQVFYRVKGPDNMFLTSDVTHLYGMKPGRYNFMGSEVVYTEDGLIRNPVLNVLAGASFPVRKGVENMMKLGCCTRGSAFNLASRNVARLCRLPDRGTLERGKRADLIFFSISDHEIRILKTIVKGNVVYES